MTRYGQRGPSVTAYIGLTIAVSALIALSVAAIFSNSVPVIGLVIAAIAAVFLVARPDLSISMLLVLGLLVNGTVVLFFPALSKAAWLLSGLGLLLLLGATAAALSPSCKFGSTGGVVEAAACFFAYSLLVTAANLPEIPEAAAGFKRYFQFWGLLFTLAVVPFALAIERRWFKWLLFVASAQVFLAVYQRVVLVPKRVGMGYGVVPIDVVSGTFEASLEGGGQSAMMAGFLLVILAFLIVAWREKALPRTFVTALGVLVIVPLGLGETKIVLVLLPLILLISLSRYVRKSPVSASLLIIIGLAATVGLAFLYLGMTGKPGQSIDSRIEGIIAYNLGSAGYSGTAFGLNRTTALTFWWAQQSGENPLYMVFGHGLGGSYSGSGALVVGHLAGSYGFIDIGLTTASSILWDIGLLGLLMFFSIFFFAWRATVHLSARVSAPLEVAQLIAMRCAIVVFLIMTFYSNAITSSPSAGILFCFVFGCVAAWRRRGSVAAKKLPISGAAFMR